MTARGAAAPAAAVTDDPAPPPLPRRIHLELTNRCNSPCRICVRTFRPEPDRDMTLDEVDRIVAGLPDLRSVALHVNGEPLLHHDLGPVIRLLAGRGVTVELNTNALALDGERARTLLDAGLAELNMSLDGVSAAAFRELRGLDGRARVLRNLAAFMRLRGSAPARPRVALWMVATRHNLHELPALVDLAGSLGVEQVYLQRLVTFGLGRARAVDSLHGRMSPADVAAIEAATRRARLAGVELHAAGHHDPLGMLAAPGEQRPWLACRRPWDSATVMADGTVVPCCISTFVGSQAAIRMGNLAREDWRSVWSGTAYTRLRAAQIHGDGPDFCRGCGVDWSL